jgi:hypothetical protein
VPVRALSPLRTAQDQAIIGACLATAMAAGGEGFTTVPIVEPRESRERSELQVALVERSRAMRLAARHQCETARMMRADNDAIAEHLRTR